MSSLRSPAAMLKALLVRMPLIVKTIVSHSLQLTPASKKQDLRTYLIVAIIRSFLDASLPVSIQQRRSMTDPGIKGPMWVSKVTLPAPGDEVRAAVLQAVSVLLEGEEAALQTVESPTVIPVEAEWTGYRDGVGKNAPQPDISEKAKYDALKAEAESDMVILYIHGGALYLMDPCTHRISVMTLCKLTGARALSVRYRLAPQNPFPAALLDILTAYLSLIHPPADSFHDPVPAKKIIISGDSAGGNLSLALLQTLLTLKKVSATIQFHGNAIPIELPAGLALTSPWCDITRSMPSIYSNEMYDYLPSPSSEFKGKKDPTESLYHPPPNTPDAIWPRNPPRSDFYCNASLVAHPLVSPLACSAGLWKDSPPVYIALGEEALSDEGLLTARRIHQTGTPVIVEQYEGMPHCFGFIMVKSTVGKIFFQGMSQFCRDAVAGSINSSHSQVGNVTFHNLGWKTAKSFPLDSVHEFTDAEVDKLLRGSRKKRMEWEEKLFNEWRAKANL